MNKCRCSKHQASKEAIKNSFNKYYSKGLFKLEALIAYIVNTSFEKGLPINRVKLNSLIFYSYYHGLYNGINILDIDEISICRSGPDFNTESIGYYGLFDQIGYVDYLKVLMLIDDNKFILSRENLPVEWFSLDRDMKLIIDEVVNSYSNYHFWDISIKVKDEIKKLYSSNIISSKELLLKEDILNMIRFSDAWSILGDKNFQSSYTVD